MSDIIKKTTSCDLGREVYIIALMNKLGFKEVERHITGGLHSSERIIITFEGLDSDYHENDYVKRHSGNGDFYYYYSLKVPDGYYTDTFSIFKSVHDKCISDIEVLSF